ncbi:hypothetical protein QR680_013426 [Steinernema hermaphroditum]|uniref:UBC core domain-containing protein n=1 Tax=Steinernema hermaphroditum TaxID=289476 RepID=A0AA39I5H2_9BILA|nr:hypothetical protein QR680_013426 [Steinernema hermaphroditum]
MAPPSPPKKKHGSSGNAGGHKDKKRGEKERDKDCGVDKDLDVSSPEQLLSTEAWERIKEAAVTRLKTEQAEIVAAESDLFKVEKATEGERKWTILMTPNKPPYNQGAFRLTIDFPQEWPYKPPSVAFQTKTYHPNIDEKGHIIYPLLVSENWKPTARVEHILSEIGDILSTPRMQYGGRHDLIELALTDSKAFETKAAEFTKANSEARPL